MFQTGQRGINTVDEFKKLFALTLTELHGTGFSQLRIV